MPEWLFWIIVTCLVPVFFYVLTWFVALIAWIIFAIKLSTEFRK